MPDQSPLSLPLGLLQWAGHRSGGVRRLFDDGSGRPSGSVIQTNLLDRLYAWSQALANQEVAPRTVLLVGGPGNGKTEAVELVIRQLDRNLDAGGRLVDKFSNLFAPPPGLSPPRRAQVEIEGMVAGAPFRAISVVQDASVPDHGTPGRTPASLLVADLQLRAPDEVLIICVNRGVLDNALNEACIEGAEDVRSLISHVVQAVGLSPDAPPCWPLKGYPDVAVWPMDVESLLVARSSGEPSPGHQLLSVATQQERWPEESQCPAGERCPFCTSRAQLANDQARDSLLTILRWYELATGKRWSFRDLFSLISYLLAGSPSGLKDEPLSPCEWAAQLLEVRTRHGGKHESLKAKVPYLLVASQYQHALFGRWPRLAGRGLRADLKDLKLDQHPTLLGFHNFLAARRAAAVPATLAPQLATLTDALDPAIADPDDDIEMSARTTVKLRDIDARFSQSAREGLQFVRKYRCLTTLETELLEELADADELLGEGDVRRRRPATALRIQQLIRDFSCRLVRRTLGVRSAVVRDASTLKAYQLVISDDEGLLHEAVKQIESLLNEHDRFVVSLNTTFGEPLPPAPRRSTLVTERQKVRPRSTNADGRPRPSLKFLLVGALTGAQSIPLTYELFHSVRLLRSGMMPASLPRTVVALLDTTRAKLSGGIVRNEEVLEGSEIRIGLRSEVVVRELEKFLVRQETTR